MASFRSAPYKMVPKAASKGSGTSSAGGVLGIDALAMGGVLSGGGATAFTELAVADDVSGSRGEGRRVGSGTGLKTTGGGIAARAGGG